MGDYLKDVIENIVYQPLFLCILSLQKGGCIFSFHCLCVWWCGLCGVAECVANSSCLRSTTARWPPLRVSVRSSARIAAYNHAIGIAHAAGHRVEWVAIALVFLSSAFSTQAFAWKIVRVHTGGRSCQRATGARCRVFGTCLVAIACLRVCVFLAVGVDLFSKTHTHCHNTQTHKKLHVWSFGV